MAKPNFAPSSDIPVDRGEPRHPRNVAARKRAVARIRAAGQGIATLHLITPDACPDTPETCFAAAIALHAVTTMVGDGRRHQCVLCHGPLNREQPPAVIAVLWTGATVLAGIRPQQRSPGQIVSGICAACSALGRLHERVASQYPELRVLPPQRGGGHA